MLFGMIGPEIWTTPDQPQLTAYDRGCYFTSQANMIYK